MLRLQDDEGKTHIVDQNERIVDHSGTDLISIRGMQEVYAAQCAQDDEEQEIHYLVVGNLRIIEQIMIVDEFCKMTDQSIYIIGVGEVTR